MHLIFAIFIITFLPYTIFGASAFGRSNYNSPGAKDCVQVSKNDTLNREVLELRTAFDQKDYKKVVMQARSIINEYKNKAKQEQSALKEPVWESNDRRLVYDALNSVSLALYWEARALYELGEAQRSQESGSELLKKFYFGQCITASGEFTRPDLDLTLDLKMFSGKK